MMNAKNSKGIVFMGVAFELVALCIGGFYLGDYIDEQMGWKATASTYLVLILLISWFFHLFILLRKFEKDNEESDGSQP